MSAPFENGAVVLLLQGGELHVDDGLFFGRDVRSHVLLGPAQQMRLEPFLQLLHLIDRFNPPVTFVELFHVRELRRFNVMEEGPELLRVVLQGRARHEDAVLIAIPLQPGLGDNFQTFVQFAFPVSKPVGLVDDDAPPGDLPDFLGGKRASK